MKGMFGPLNRKVTRPHLEYSEQASSLLLKKDVTFIEQVHGLAARWVQPKR